MDQVICMRLKPSIPGTRPATQRENRKSVDHVILHVCLKLISICLVANIFFDMQIFVNPMLFVFQVYYTIFYSDLCEDCVSIFDERLCIYIWWKIVYLYLMKAQDNKNLKILWLLQSPELQTLLNSFPLLVAHQLQTILCSPVTIHRAGTDRVEPVYSDYWSFWGEIWI